MPIALWPNEPRLPSEPRYFRHVAHAIFLFLGGFAVLYHFLPLRYDYISHPVFYVTAFMAMLLSTYWTSNVGDVHYILDRHYELVHLRERHPESARQMKDYWDGVKDTWVFQYLGYVLFCVRLLVYLYCASRSYWEAFYFAVGAFVQLGMIIFNPKRKFSHILLFLRLAFRYFPFDLVKWEWCSPSRMFPLMIHGILEILLRTIVEYIRQIYAMNEFPCWLCDFDWPDIWTAAVLPDEAQLAQYQQKHCAHCWMDWAIGDVVAVFRCGHIFHKHCNDQWLRMRGRHVCSMCQFVVQFNEGQKRPLRRMYTQYQANRLERDPEDHRCFEQVLADGLLLDVRITGRERAIYRIPEREPTLAERRSEEYTERALERLLKRDSERNLQWYLENWLAAPNHMW